MHTFLSFRTPALLLACIAALTFSASAGEPVRAVADLNGKRLGVLTGTMLDTAANSALDFTQIEYFDNNGDQIDSLYAREIDAFIDDEPVARFLASRHAALFVVPGILMKTDYGYAMRKNDNALFNRVNPLVRKKVADGTVKRLEQRWLDSTEGEDAAAAGNTEASAENAAAAAVNSGKTGNAGVKTLRFGVSPVSAPFVYEAAGRIIGLDIDLMRAIAEELGMRLEVKAMEFAELIPALQSGEVDVIGSCYSITEEREKIVRFTDSYYAGGAVAITLK